MKLSIRSCITLGLIFFFFGAFQGGIYTPKFRLQELSLLTLLLLFAYTVCHSSFDRRSLKWEWWTFVPLIFALSVMVVYALVFSMNTGQAMVPSVLALRYFLIILIAPVIYFLHKLGYEIKTLEKTLLISFFILLLNYLFNYFTMDLEAAYFSPNHSYASLVTFDEWRGYRLKAPFYVILLLVLFVGMSLFQANPWHRRLGYLCIFSVCIYILLIVMSRAAILTLLLSIVAYPFMFKHPNRISLNLFIFPLALIFINGFLVAAIPIFVEHIANDWSFKVRMKSYQIALEVLFDYPLFGFGQSSYYTQSYQQIFGEKFYPSDLGIIGAAFKHGFIGIIVYLFFKFYILFRLIRVNWAYQLYYGRHNPLLWSLLILIFSLLVNILLQAAFIFAAGLTLASITIGLTACYYDELNLHNGSVFPRRRNLP